MTDLSLILVVTLLAGMASVVVRLPPLVGFLVAGFALNAMGVAHFDGLDTLADLGVTLLLFGIGLKLDVRTLIRREVWLTATVHMVLSTALATAFLGLLAVVGVGLLTEADWRTLVVVGFALSFSSTVLVVKVLEDQSSSQSRYGRTAVGILIIQDLAAVVFLTVTKGSPPSPWAVGLVLLVPAAWLLRRALRRVGHGELLPLFGMVVALVPGYLLFEAVGLKGDLGALVMGLLLAPEPGSAGLAKALFSVKELLLVGFFLSIGFTGIPSLEHVLVAGVLMLLVPVKAAGFVLLLWWRGMRHRTSVLTGASLANYSEFGLIVIVVGASTGLVGNDWLLVLSTAVAGSFVVSAAINRHGDGLVVRAERALPAQDPATLHPDDRPIDVGHAHAVVLGMGRVGSAVYRQLTDVYGLQVVGVESEGARAARLRDEGLDVVEGDATDPDFWERLTQAGTVDIAVLAMPFHGANVTALEKLEASDFKGTVAAVAQYDDDAIEAREMGAHAVYGLYDGAGVALADKVADAAGLTRTDGDADADG
ncbi:cation:proton antiporter family protein [Nocardioides sp.]|uniref:cation:proton antiporter family protein n=1 Tax=Nocardioides sp. TaxID=35761 RepID=UPI0027342FA9|nr:cation:proton antiporter family protein [Nocardioides sp.]MDP3891786.1 cation:proton antiporter [Nocardioides sp.]